MPADPPRRGIGSLDPETYARLAVAWEAYRPEQRRRLERLTAAADALVEDPLDQNAARLVAREVHALGGAAAMYGFGDAKRLAIEIEDGAGAERIEPDDARAIKRAVAAFRDAVDQPLPPSPRSG